MRYLDHHNQQEINDKIRHNKMEHTELIIDIYKFMFTISLSRLLLHLVAPGRGVSVTLVIHKSVVVSKQPNQYLAEHCNTNYIVKFRLTS